MVVGVYVGVAQTASHFLQTLNPSFLGCWSEFAGFVVIGMGEAVGRVGVLTVAVGMHAGLLLLVVRDLVEN